MSHDYSKKKARGDTSLEKATCRVIGDFNLPAEKYDSKITKR
jgi:hypothetical protein